MHVILYFTLNIITYLGLCYKKLIVLVECFMPLFHKAHTVQQYTTTPAELFTGQLFGVVGGGGGVG